MQPDRRARADRAPSGAADLRALCVSIHDVAPATWPACRHLLRAVREVADIPLTFLVVPRFHGDAVPDPAFDDALRILVAARHELALHGYTHVDDGPPAHGVAERMLRRVYTTGEGEFAALGADEARRRIALGLEWFGERGWHPSGFVPPAWLLGKQAWCALRGYRFAYTTTYRYLHVLARQDAQHGQEGEDGLTPPAEKVFAPALVYAARNRAGRALSPPAVGALACALRRAPLVRLSLHPRDASHPALVRHAQQLIARLLAGREALTKAAVAARCGAAAGGSCSTHGLTDPAAITSTDPRIHPRPSAAAQSRSSTTDHTAERLPWH